MIEMRKRLAVSGIKEGMVQEKVGVVQKGSRWEPHAGRNVLHLDCINVNILVLILNYTFTSFHIGETVKGTEHLCAVPYS